MIFLVDLPPPTHGMANVNLSFIEAYRAQGGTPKIINTSPSYAGHFFKTKFWLFFKIFHSAWCFLYLFFASFSNFSGVVYRPINGGSGQLFDLFFILTFKIFKNKIYIHHHSYRYINEKRIVFSMLTILLGKNTKHVVLSPKMADDLSKIYKIRRENIISISNVVFMSAPTEGKKHSEILTIGHLSNLCFEKGVDDFIKICSELKLQNIDFKAVIAGPFENNSVKNFILKALEESDNIDYLGPVYSTEKAEFYSMINCFIFLSRYENEAEPLVLYEAAQAGSFLIGSDRGCMEEAIYNLRGQLIKDTDNPVLETTNFIKENIHLITSSDERSKRVKLFKNLRSAEVIKLESLIKEMAKNEFTKPC